MTVVAGETWVSPNKDQMVVDTVWTDVETTGLDSTMDYLLEVGVIVLDAQFQEIGTFRSLVLPNTVLHIQDMMSADVRNMHEKSGLLHDLREFENAGKGIEERSPVLVDRRLRSFLDLFGEPKTFEMCGSTINFDRAFYSEDLCDAHKWFHYRNIDVSTLKNVCRRRAPQLYKAVPQPTSEDKKHRVLDDIRTSIKEYRFYCEHLINGVQNS